MISLPTAGYAAFDGDVRYMRIQASIDLSSSYLDPSLTVNLLAGGDFFGTASQIANDIVSALEKRFVLGTSLFGGTDILMGSDIECGWTSTELSGVGGAFSTSPSIEMTFTSRNIEQIEIYGDDKWAEYPVDFTVDLYYSGSYTNEITITNNTEVHYSYALPVTRTDVTKAKLTVSKWSKAGVPSKIYEFKVGRTIELTQDDIISTYVLEEDNYKSDTLPIASLSSNQLTLSFYNNNDIDLTEMKMNKSVRMYFIATASSVDYSVDMGKYFTSDWQIDTLNNIITIIAFDLMSVLYGDVYNATYSENKTAYELIDEILTDSQLLSSLYVIDEDLRNYTIPASLFEPISHQEALSRVLAAVLGNAYVDRTTGRLKILSYTSSQSSGVSQKTFTDASTVLPGTYTPIELDRVATKVDVTWSELVTNVAEDVIESTEVTEVSAGGTAQTIYEFPGDYLTVTNISTPSFTQSGADITLTGYTVYSWGIVCNFANSGGTAQNLLSVTVNGQPITRITHIYSQQNDAAIAKYGKITYEYDNILIQSREQAVEVATNILDTYSDPVNIIVNNLWGAPYLVIGDTVTVPSTTATNVVQIERQEITYDNNGFEHKITSKIVG